MTLLTEPKPTIPSRWYYGADHYQEELEAVWYADWVCVGREEDLPRSGDYITTEIGDQGVIIVRSENGLRAYHNTCRHRGARICTAESGRFRNGRIICPYHTWTYSLEGELVKTPHRLDTGAFDATKKSLYQVSLETWRGFVFINLAEEPAVTLHQQLGGEAEVLRNWPLEAMRSVHQVTKRLDCNWKVYWENYSECYHCPRVHPSLCHIMPVYKHATAEAQDIAGWTPADNGEAETWSPDGKSTLPLIEGLNETERQAVVSFASFTASMYIVAHRDYVRTVRLVPKGPEKVDLVIDWLLPSKHADISEEQLRPVIDFSIRVIAEDSEMCERNQKGLHSRRHDHGTLVEQEYEVYDFHNWLREKLERHDA